MSTFQKVVFDLHKFWEKEGCAIHAGHGVEMGAGTFNPATFFRCLGPEPYKAAYLEPCRRPTDGRYGENPNRVQQFFQYQVILKPSPLGVQDLYLKSLEAIGFDLSKHDIRFVHDDWESPTLGAWGLGWEVWIDGMEVTQFTYFQSVAGLELSPITAEITYGVERLCMYLQKKKSIFDIAWGGGLSYGDVYHRNEIEWSHYNFTAASTEMWKRHFTDYQKETKDLLAKNLPIPAYEFVMKASHAFNILDARGVISVTERTGYIAAIRNLAHEVALQYVESREKQGFPLLRGKKEEEVPPSSKPLSTHLEHPKTGEQEDFLLEIGTEELPATFVPIGMAQLEKHLCEFLIKNGIPFKSVSVFGTPRRLSALVSQLSLLKPAESIEKKGPPLDRCFDDEGNPTKAGEGFIRTLGLENVTLGAIRKGKIKDLEIRSLKDVDYLFATVTSAEIPTATLLQQSLAKLIQALEFPKKMRWDPLSPPFARPIRWIVALLGNEVISFPLGRLLSSNVSYGHRRHSPGPIPIQHPNEYKTLLKEGKVLVDVADRKESIVKQLQEIEKNEQVEALAQDDVMKEVLFLAEWPNLASVPFSETFLKAPKELLVKEMVDHQRYFPLAHNNGSLKNQFVITADTTPTQEIMEGNQKVLAARLSDGVFLYEEDLKMGLKAMNEKLKTITFQKELGTLAEKVDRIEKHAHTISHHLQIKDPKNIAKAASLCKADLASHAVYEFPELQGTMGRYYADAEHLPKEVALAIDEHWSPRGEGGKLPETEAGIIVSLADKIDNLLGCYCVGLKPTSSSDPYALRRQAIGLIRIAIASKLRFSLPNLLSDCLNHFPAMLRKADAVTEIVSFIQTRMKHTLEEFHLSKDEAEATLSFGFTDIYDAFRKVEALHEFRTSPAFSSLLEVYKRAKGQISTFKTHPFAVDLLHEPAEKNLATKLEQIEKPFATALSACDYKKAYELIAEVQPPLATLFNEVKILADDPKIQQNRIALLQKVFTLFEKLLDFSKIQQS